MCAGLEACGLSVEGGEDAGFRAITEAAIREVGRKDLIYAHIAMPDRIVQHDDGKGKVNMIEEYDRQIVGPLLDVLSQKGPYRVLLVCDGFFTDAKPPIVPLMPYTFHDGESRPSGPARRFCRADAEAAQAGARDATKLIARLLPRTA